jgi:hypothetical protein
MMLYWEFEKNLSPTLSKGEGVSSKPSSPKERKRRRGALIYKLTDYPCNLKPVT